MPPIAFDTSAASTTKSGFDLRPKPPPSSVTLTVTFSAGRPSRFATRSCAACGDWLQAQTSHAPLTMRAVAAGHSIGACAKCGT